MRTHLDPPRPPARTLWRAAPWLLALVLDVGRASGAAQSLIEGVDSWAEATAGASNAKWVGPRVPFPTPTPRPTARTRLDSTLFPVSVHAAASVRPTRVLAALRALEESYALLEATGWIDHYGDGGQAGTGGHDVYLVEAAERGAAAFIDASEPAWGYDGARAFGVVDARVPEANLRVCTTQALLEALLYELDPAEADSVRQSSAAYVAWLATGELGCDDDAERALDEPSRAPFARDSGARGAVWLARLGDRQDHNSGNYVRDMWQFARQRTWEGRDLRASPDLFECIDRTFAVRHDHFEDVLGELADDFALVAPPVGVAPRLPMRVVTWEALPEHLAPSVMETLGSTYALVRLGGPHPGERLRVWSRGELGARWSLSATKLDAQGRPSARLGAPARKNPNSNLIVELDASTHAVLISLTNTSDGIPDADLPDDPFVHAAMLIVDREKNEVPEPIPVAGGAR